MSGRSAGSVAGLIIGGVVGSFVPVVGTALGASIGSFVGGLAGGLYDSANTKFDDVVNRQERLADLALQTSTLGIPIPQIWGRIGGLSGNIFWATDKVPHEMRQVIEPEAAKGGPTGPRQVTITITYTQSYAIGLCDTRLTGPISGITRISKNSNLFWERGASGALPDGWTLYPGTATQDPDPTIEAALGVGLVPRYPYLCYVVVADDDQGASGQTPIYSFEVAQDALATGGGYTGAMTSLGVNPVDDHPWAVLPQLLHVYEFTETPSLDNDVLLYQFSDSQYATVSMPIAFGASGDVWILDGLKVVAQVVDYATRLAYQRVLYAGVSFTSDLLVLDLVGERGYFCTTSIDTTNLVWMDRAGAGTEIAVSFSGRQSLALASGSMWVAGSGGTLDQVDLVVGLAGTLGGMGEAWDMRAAAGALWVVDRTGGVVRRVSPAVPSITATITVGSTPVQIAEASDGALWVACLGDSTVARINPATNTVTHTVTVPGLAHSSTERILAPGVSGGMWVLQRLANEAALVSASGTTTAHRTAQTPWAIADAGSGDVWVTSTDGGRLERLGAAPVQVSTGNTLATVVTALCTAVGLTAINVTALPSALVNMILLNVEAARVPLEQLAQALRFYAVESGTSLVFRERGTGALTFAITEDELGAGEGQADEAGLRVRRLQEADLPTSIEIAYVDPAQNYQRNTQPGQLALPASGIENARTINIGSIALAADEARQLASELAVEAWVQREVLHSTLRRTYATLEPGDRGTITARGLTYTVVMTETSYGQPGLVEFTARPDAAYIRGALITVPGVVPPSDQTPTLVGDTTALLCNLMALSGSDASPRYHVLYSGENAPWEGGGLYRSVDGGASYGLIDFAVLEGIVGTVALATANADWHFLDTTTSLTVVLEYGTLTSIADATLYAGGNLCAIGSEANGWEILGFGVATLVSAGTYTLTRLLRGRRGTEYEVSGHGVSERFLLLDAGARAVGMDLADRSIVRSYKAVTLGQALSDVTASTFTPTAQNLNPWTVAQGVATKVVNDWVLTWFMRSRFNGADDFSPIGFEADFLGFRVDIYQDGTFAVLLRSTSTDGGTPLEANTQKTWTYDAAMQVADFGGLQSTLFFRIFQVTDAGLSAPENLAA